MERQREIEALSEALDERSLAAEQAHERVAERNAQPRSEPSLPVRREQARQQELHGERVEVLKLGQALQRASERRSQLDHDLADLKRSEEAERELLARAQLELERCTDGGFSAGTSMRRWNLRESEQAASRARSVESALSPGRRKLVFRRMRWPNSKTLRATGRLQKNRC
ncbi:MAG: hypothetical protein R3E33_02920 [Rhodocyclaceae bacterium]